MKHILFKTALFSLLLCAFSCKHESQIQDNKVKTAKPKAKPLPTEFKKYWYAGQAEVTSYSLEQARYGELRNGTAMLIYVTEPFKASKQVKADAASPDNVSVLKLNATKSFLTGIYPYSVMTSTFYPVADNSNALKVTNSVQEWCGQVFAQINNKEDFEIATFSYFESEGDQQFSLKKNTLENEIWSKIRIHPSDMPTGELQIIPALEYLRFSHNELKAYTANATITNQGDLTAYRLDYPELERSLTIKYTTLFPHTIEGWTETYKSGYGQDAKVLTTTATKINRINTAYWQQNSNKHLPLRDSLGL
ncbi:septum formation inhibitor Maf [Cellulophaga sp. F20128]|uniref:septum formation inhibitor Maf n=1 Tax=Cellulophaga sp. F20128 TaxID=2926413 RepID=UPI001FF53D12|nr:septum formation inhibitor Maf [Cellulophaga sp. F20128]MCK0157083.1 septum formation inhibitor Maf [Cellulophaga sp. F20128]